MNVIDQLRAEHEAEINIYVDENGNPIDHQAAQRGIGSGQLQPEMQTMPMRPGDYTKPGDIQNMPYNPKDASPDDFQNMIGGQNTQPIGSGPGGQLLPGDPGYLSNERRYGGQPLEPVQPTIGGYTPESELRAEYDRQMEQDRQRVLEERRLGEAGDKRYAKFDPSGYRHPQTPMPAEKGTAAYESGYNRHSGNVYKAQKKAGEELKAKRAREEKDRVLIDAKKAETEKKKAETDRLKRPPEPLPPGWERGPDGKAYRIKSPSAAQLDRRDKIALNNFKAKHKITGDFTDGFVSKPMTAEQAKAMKEEAAKLGLNVYFDEGEPIVEDKPGLFTGDTTTPTFTVSGIEPNGTGGQQQTSVGGGNTPPQRQKQYVWKDEQGNLFTAPNETEVPAQYRRSARVIDLGEVQGGAVLGGDNQVVRTGRDKSGRTVYQYKDGTIGYNPQQQKPTGEAPAREKGKGAVAPRYGKRADGTPKGKGYFGEIQRPDGKVSTELSIGVTFDGKETEIPSLVPTLTKEEVDYLIQGGKPTEAIIQKAVEHAKQRMAEGKSPFAQEGEQPGENGNNPNSIVRRPSQSENEYFKEHPNVGGMADFNSNTVILNPYSNLSDSEKDAVVKNEMTRLYLRKKNVPLNFTLTPSQKEAFKGYGNEKQIKETIIARIVSGDPSALDITDDQKHIADKVKGQMNYGPSGENMTVGDVVAKLADSVGEEQARKFTESLSKKYGGNPSLDMKIDPSVIKEIQSAARETGIAASFINDWLATMWNTAGIATKNVGRGIANIPIPGTRK